PSPSPRPSASRSRAPARRRRRTRPPTRLERFSCDPPRAADTAAHAGDQSWNPRLLVGSAATTRSLVLILGVVVGEVDLAAVLLGLAEDLELPCGEDLAVALERDHQLLVHAELLALEDHRRHERLLAALVEVLVERRQHLLRVGRDVVDLDLHLD